MISTVISNPRGATAFRWLGLVWAICLCWGLLSGCSVAAVRTDRLVFGQISDPSSFNYYLSTGNATRDVLAYTMGGLTTTDPDTLLSMPELAEGWQESEDGLTYVFTLRQGLRWSDGEPLTAADVDFTFNDIIFNDAIPTSSRDVQRIGEEGSLPQVRALDQRRIEFVLPEPFAPFLIQAGSPIMPRHILKPAIDDVDDEGNPAFLRTWDIQTPVEQIISSGPYIISEYTPNQRVIYQANPYYWKNQDPSLAPSPRIPTLVIRLVDSQDTEFLQFRSRELDSYNVRGSDFRLLKQEEERDQFTIYELGATLNNNFLAFNQSIATQPESGQPFVDPVRSRWFRDLRFRQAVAHALDRQGLVDGVLQGLGQVQHYTISPASPFHLSPEEGAPRYNYDPELARSLLLEAGFEYGEDGFLRDEAGNRVRFTLQTNAGNNEREATGSRIQADLAAIGITVDFNPVAFNTLIERINSREWEAILLSFGGGWVEPNNGANIWRSSGRLHLWNLGSQPGSEADGVEVTEWEREIDSIFAQGTRELDFESRKRLYDRYQIIAQEQLPLIGTFNPLVLTAVRDRVEGVDPRPILGTLWNLDELTVELQPE